MKKLLRSVFVTTILGLASALTADAQPVTLFSDDLENGSSGWAVAGSTDSVNNDGGYWHLSQRLSSGNTTNTCWYYGIESTGDCGTNDYNNGSITTPSIDLTSVTNATLTFNHRPRGESDWPVDDDMVNIEVTTDNGATWTSPCDGLLVGWEMWGMGGGWTDPQMTVDLSAYAGQTIKIRFSIYITRLCGEHIDLSLCPITEGWYIDDVTVTGE